MIQAAVIHPDKAAQGLHGAMALVAVGPTIRRARCGKGERFKGGAVTRRGLPELDKALERVALESAAGVWKIELRNNKDAAAGSTPGCNATTPGQGAQGRAMATGGGSPDCSMTTQAG